MVPSVFWRPARPTGRCAGSVSGAPVAAASTRGPRGWPGVVVWVRVPGGRWGHAVDAHRCSSATSGVVPLLPGQVWSLTQSHSIGFSSQLRISIKNVICTIWHTIVFDGVLSPWLTHHLLQIALSTSSKMEPKQRAPLSGALARGVFRFVPIVSSRTHSLNGQNSSISQWENKTNHTMREGIKKTGRGSSWEEWKRLFVSPTGNH